MEVYLDNAAKTRVYDAVIDTVVQAMRTSAKRVLYTVLHSRAMDGIAK